MFPRKARGLTELELQLWCSDDAPHTSGEASGEASDEASDYLTPELSERRVNWTLRHGSTFSTSSSDQDDRFYSTCEPTPR